MPAAGARWPFLVVPGYCPRVGWSRGLHATAIRRLERALAVHASGAAAAIIVSGGAVHSPDNEAVLMRAWLIERGVDARRVVVEPCARHTTTNLRNAGRIILDAGARESLVVTSGAQLLYLRFPFRSSFHARCIVELGYRVGALERHDDLVAFRPSAAVFRRGRSARDP